MIWNLYLDIGVRKVKLIGCYRHSWTETFRNVTAQSDVSAHIESQTKRLNDGRDQLERSSRLSLYQSRYN